MLKIKLTAIAATLGLAALSLAAFDGYSLKHTPKVGDVHKYKQSGKFEVGGTQVDYEATSTEKVVKVEDSGNYSIENTSSDVKINGDDHSDSSAKTTSTFSPRGEIVELKGDNIDGGAYRFANLSVVVSPEMDVKVGDTWTYDIKEDKKLGTVAGKASYTLVSEEKVGTIDTIKLKYSVKETGADGASSEGTLWLNKADYTLVKVTSKWVNAPVPGAPVPISGDITVTLVQ